MKRLRSAPTGTALAWLTLAAVPVMTAAHAASAPTGEWNFVASLNDKPIGEHRFTLTGAGDERRLVGEANFDVRFIGISAYRYQHRVAEKWRGNCLVDLVSTTNDDGKVTRVRTRVANQGATTDQGLVVSTDNAASVSLPGCVMSFAYWNPAIQAQTRLLNAQTGKSEQVLVARVGSARIDVRGQSTAATQWRITGAANPIDIWYSASGEWIGLDATVDAGRTLRYRLK